MQVVEEPFVTRDAIVSILRPGELTTERPFRTLRERGAASPGIAVPVRTARGRVLGRVQLYNALNADAARAYRLGDPRLAQALARRASELEATPWAMRIRDAISAAAARLPIDSRAADAPGGLRRYVEARRRATPQGLDHVASAREWIARAEAWLPNDESSRAELVDALVELDRAACEARADLLDPSDVSVTTFFGVVRRLDAFAGEVEGADSVVLIPRDDLDRQGLAVLGQPVAILREGLPGGGSYSLPVAAVDLAPSAPPVRKTSPWDLQLEEDTTMTEDGKVFTLTPIISDRLTGRDAEWLQSEMRRSPVPAPVAPLRVA